MARVIGVDAHKATLTCSAVDELGREIDSITAANDGRGFARIVRFALRVGATRVGIECSGSYGLALAQHLVAAGFDVKEVPGQLVKQLRRALAKGKNDSLDALLIARVVAREKKLPPPPLKGVTHDLKALVDHRETLLREATRHRNRAHAMLTQLRPGYWRMVPALTSARRLQAARRLVEDDTGVRAQLLLDTLARVEELQSSAKVMERQIEALVKASGTSLTDIVGVSAITAARILAELRDVGRVSDQSAFGALTGTAPVPASSGQVRSVEIEPRWQPPAQQGNTHHRTHPDQSRCSCSCISRTETSSRQEPQKRDEMPQEAPCPSRLQAPPRGPRAPFLDIEA